MVLCIGTHNLKYKSKIIFDDYYGLINKTVFTYAFPTCQIQTNSKHDFSLYTLYIFFIYCVHFVYPNQIFISETYIFIKDIQN